MATISKRAWNRYIAKLRQISDKAADGVLEYIATHDMNAQNAYVGLIEYAYALSTKYGDAATALACEMYEAMAELSGNVVPPAVPAATADKATVAKAVNGTRLQNDNVTAGAISRLVKRSGVDTIQQNAIRDGYEWAWIPSGDTCAFCLALASRGWQKASKKALKNGHAEHIHANCDCTYAIRAPGSDLSVEGYDPNTYKTMYDEAEGATPNEKINSMRRQFYAENKGIVGAESSAAEEFIPSFVPGKSVQEVEDMLREYVDEDRFGALGVSLKGIDLDVANEAAEAISRFFQTYDVEKFGGVFAPAKNTKLGKLINNATAAYSEIRNSLLLNKDSLKTAKVAKKALAAEREAFQSVMNHPERYNMDGLSARVRRVIEQGKISGRGTVPETVTEVINHELGHSLEKKIRRLPNYERLKERMTKYAPKISGYATEDFSEYVAESFASYCKGENVADPEMIKAFKSLRRK